MLGWRWAPFASYLLLVLAVAYTFYVQDQNDRESDQAQFDACVQADRERQSLYDLMTLRPVPENTPTEIKMKVFRAQLVFSQPTDCDRLLDR